MRSAAAACYKIEGVLCVCEKESEREKERERGR